MIDYVQKHGDTTTARTTVMHPLIADLPYVAQEAVNILRGNIQLSGNGIKVIAITSSHQDEGKSSVSVQLAKSFAALNKTTVYLDCDIRKSKTLRRYQIYEQVVGLTEYLCGNCCLEDIVYQTDNPYMDMVFTGAVAPNPSELLTDTLFDDLLDTLRQSYDYVIVDTAPINAVIDGAVVSKRCDGTVLVLEQAVTARADVIHMKKQLDYVGVKVIGAVLNKVGADPNGYGYGYGYGGAVEKLIAKIKGRKEKNNHEWT